MTEKGFCASLCDFFKGLFSPEQDQTTITTAAPEAATKSSGGLSGVERYIKNKPQKDSLLSGVDQYVGNQANSAQSSTSVESYLHNQTASKPLTGVERYLRSKG